jgi:hypothetical protein
MSKLSQEEEGRKRAIFEGMSPRRQRKILEKGYDNWDPFQPPRDPIDLRTDKNRYTAAMLAREFLATQASEGYSRAYSQGVWEICVGIVSSSDRYTGMYEFSCWYRDFSRRRNLNDSQGAGDHERNG